MAKTAIIRARTEPEVKARAEAIMKEIGLSPSAAITMLYKAIIRQRALPFQPNAATRAAMRDTSTGENLIHADSMDELFGVLDEGDG